MGRGRASRKTEQLRARGCLKGLHGELTDIERPVEEEEQTRAEKEGAAAAEDSARCQAAREGTDRGLATRTVGVAWGG